jgi:arginine repressor
VTIRELIKSRPDAPPAEAAEALGKRAGQATVSRTLRRLGLPWKKVDARIRRTRMSKAGPT